MDHQFGFFILWITVLITIIFLMVCFKVEDKTISKTVWSYLLVTLYYISYIFIMSNG